MMERRALALLAAVSVSGLTPGAAQGGASPAALACQRVLGRAVASCVVQTVRVERECIESRLAAEPCDAETRDSGLTAARKGAAEDVVRFCTDDDLSALGFEGTGEALARLAAACEETQTAVTSAAYRPATVGGATAAVAPTKQACLEAVVQTSARMVSFALRARRRVLDRVVAGGLTIEQTLLLTERAESRVAAAARKLGERAEAQCEDGFESSYGRSAVSLLGDLAGRADCALSSVYAGRVVPCPAPLCGNGILEPGEVCDDGNLIEADGCRNDCSRSACDVSAYDAIQQTVFEAHECTSLGCHGEAQRGGLDLQAGASYENLIDVPATLDPSLRRVVPGDAPASLLWLKLAAGTLPERFPADDLGIGSAMPITGAPALTDLELEAVRLWIDGGAPPSGSVPAVGELLGVCPTPWRLEGRPRAIFARVR